MIKTLTPLFARGKKNQVLEWQIEVEEDKFRTVTGASGCKKVTSAWSVAKPKNVGKKNATTGSEQALLEAQSRWDLKVRCKGYWENIEDIDKVKFVEPMLAEKFKDRKHKIVYPAMLDRKYNGMRQETDANGQWSRTGEPVFSAPHIFERVKHLFKIHPKLVLDGELYNHTLRHKLNELVSLVGKKKKSSITEAALKRSEEIVKYYVYDAYNFTIDGVEITKETPCFIRRAGLTKLLAGIPDVIAVPYDIVNSEAEVYSLFQQHVADGYEGSMVRNSLAEYENERTDSLQKVKPEDDAECKIINIMEGTGNWSGTAKTATVEWNGKTFYATFKGEYEELIPVLKHPENWIGKTVTFLYLGLTGKGIPNSARIDIKNCLKGDR